MALRLLRPRCGDLFLVVTLALAFSAAAAQGQTAGGTYNITQSATGATTPCNNCAKVSVVPLTVTATLNSGVPATQLTFGFSATPSPGAPAINFGQADFVTSNGAAFQPAAGFSVVAVDEGSPNSFAISIRQNSVTTGPATVVLGVLSVPIPSGAQNGATYLFHNTGGDVQADVPDAAHPSDIPLAAGPDGTVTVANGTFFTSNGVGAPGTTVNIPVRAALNASVDALVFGIQLIPNGGAPAVTFDNHSFTVDSGFHLGVSTISGNGPSLSALLESAGSDGEQLLSTGSFQLGILRVNIPASAVSGQSYTIQFTGADSGDSVTSYDYPVTRGPDTLLSVKATASIALTSSPVVQEFGQSVVLSATVSPSSATGKVTFYDGASILGVAALSGGTATLTTKMLPAGGHSLKARYLGGPTFAPSTSLAVAQTVYAAVGAGFQSPINSNTGTTPLAIAAGDFNGDGKTDLAVANNGDGTVTIMLGNGDGTFQVAAAGSSAGANPTSVATGDFDGDGKTDLAVVSSTAHTVSIFLGNGDGTFKTAVPYAAGSTAFAVAVGDFDGDGNADLAVTSFGTSVSVLMGNGDGTFQGAVSYSAFQTASPSFAIWRQSIVAGDFNGDGKTDLAIASANGGGVAVLRGNGDGTFQTGVKYSLPFDACSLVPGELNSDGILDLVAGACTGSVTFLQGNANGLFQAFALSGNITLPGFLAIGDFDGDGKLDLAGASGSTNFFSTVLGNGNATFQSPVPINSGGSGAGFLLVGDFNGDGRADLVVANSFSSNVSVLLGVPVPLSVATSSLPSVLAGASYSQTLAAAGGVQPYTWTVASGALPNGMNLSSAGVITGSSAGNGTFNVTVQVTDGAAATATANLSLTVNAAVPVINAGSIANSASFTVPVVAGSAASIFGSSLAAGTFPSMANPLSTALGGTTVMMNGIAAAISYVSPNQINIQVPWELAGQSSASVRVTTAMGTSSPVSVALAPLAPAIYTVSGPGPGIVYKSDFSLVSASNPAFPGASVHIFVTGLGAVLNQPLDGYIASFLSDAVTTPTVTIGGVPATVVSARLTSQYTLFYQTIGVYEVIATVPTGVVGNTLSVVVTAGSVSSNTVTMAVAAAPPALAITTPSNLGTWSIGPRDNALSTSGGTGSSTWEVVSGSLPPGCGIRSDLPYYFHSAAADLSCVATTPGDYSFTLGAVSGSQTATRAFTAHVTNLRLKDINLAIPEAFVNVPYSGYTFTAVGNAGPVSWSGTGLPTGMFVSSSGVLSGTPSASGFYTLSFTLYDGIDNVTENATLNVYAVQVTSPKMLPAATQYQSYSATLTASGGTAPYSFSGTPPSGLTLNANTGVISGFVTAGPGLYNLNVTVTDASQLSYQQNASLLVIGSPKHLMSISANLNDCAVGSSCQQTVSVCCGGVAPFSWSASGLPNGMSIRSGVGVTSQYVNAGNAELWGSPDAVGNYNVTITVTDGDGSSTNRTFPLSVSPLYWQIGYPNGLLGSFYANAVRVMGGTGPGTFQQTGGQFPNGLTSAGLLLLGTPVEAGTSFFSGTFSDSASNTLHVNGSVFIANANGATVYINSPQNLGTVSANSFYSTTLQACCVPSYAWSLASGTLPPGIGLSAGGQLSGNPTTVGTYNFLIRVSDAGNSANTTVRYFTLTVGTTPASFSITTSTPLPSGNVGTLYSQTIAVAGATGTPVWTLAAPSMLPQGMNLSSAGVFSGTPAGPGSYSLTVTVTDSVGNTRSFTPVVSFYPAGMNPPLSLNFGPFLNKSLIGVNIFPLNASGGIGPYHFAYSPGAAPIPGMRVLDGPPQPNSTQSGGGSFAGVVTTPGSYTTSLRVTDSTNTTFDQPIFWTVHNLTPVSQNTSPMPKATAGIAYAYAFTGYGGSGNYSWSASNLPQGMNINATGMLSGTPATAGSYSPFITLTDLTTNISNSVTYQLTVDPFAISSSGVLPQGTVGVAYSQALTAPGCGTGCTWTLVNNSFLPSGLSLGSGGTISGTPSFIANGGFMVQAAGSNGTVQKLFNLTVNTSTIEPLFITTLPTVVNVTVGNFGAFTPFVQGGVPPYTWSVTAGSLSPGMTLQSPGELLGASFLPGSTSVAGRAMQAGSYTFTLTATDSTSASASQAFTWNIAQLSINNTSLPAAGNPLVYNTAYSQQLLVLGGSGVYPSHTMVSGALPPGLSLSAAGLVSGTPTNTGSFTAGIQVTDSLGNSVTQNVGFTVAGPGGVNVNTGVPDSTTTSGGLSTFVGFFPSGGTGPYTFISIGSLPPGCALESGSALTATTGSQLYGMACSPLAIGDFMYTVQATDSLGNVGVRTAVLRVYGIDLLTNLTLPNASVGSPYSQNILASESGPITWTLASGWALPPGLTLTGNNLYGMPSSAGTYLFQLFAQNGANFQTTFTFSLTVSTIHITTPDVIPQSIVTNTPYSFAMTATGGGSKSWSATGLPSGITLSADGVLSGTNTSPGTFQLIVSVTDGVSTYTHPFTVFSNYADPQPASFPILSTQLTNLRVGSSFSLALSTSGGAPPFTWTVADGSTLPPGLNLISGTSLSNYGTGQLVGVGYLDGSPTAAGMYTFDLIATDSASTQIRRTFTLAISPITIEIGTLKTAVVGNAYAQQLTTAGGTGPYTYTFDQFSPTADMFPPGITPSASGLISGTPTGTGVFAFIATAHDTLGNTFQVGYTLQANNSFGAAVSTQPLFGSVVGFGINTSLSANLPNPVWTVSAGALPPGLNLVTTGGNTSLAGAPTAAGTFTYTLRATSSGNSANFADRVFTGIISPMEAITHLANQLPPATMGTPYSYAIAMAGGTAPYTFVTSQTLSPLPPGLALSSSGILSGTPTATGSFSFFYQVTDATSRIGFYQIPTLNVLAPGAMNPLQGRTESFSGSVGFPSAIELSHLVSGGVGPFTWTVGPGSQLPPGLSILPGSNGLSAFIIGFPTTAGSYSYSLNVTDSLGQMGTAVIFSHTISAIGLPPTVPNGVVGAAYLFTFAPGGGVGPYQFALNLGSSLPPGLSLSPAGLLSGTPTYPGIFFMSIAVTDLANHSLTISPKVTIDNAAHQAQGFAINPPVIQMTYVLTAPTPPPTPVVVAATTGTVPFTASFGGIAGVTLSGASGTAPGTLNLQVNPSGLTAGLYTGVLAFNAPQATNPSGGVPVVLNVINAPPCDYGLTSTSGSLVAAGGKGSFGVNTGSLCTWNAVGSDLWINVHGGSGQGSNPVNFEVANNLGIDPRTGTITVGPQTFTITQFGSACALAINPTGVNVTALGGQAMVRVSSSNSACSWTATGLGAAPITGKGNGMVMLNIPASSSPSPQTMMATVAGQTFTVNQTAAGCMASLSAASASVGAAGGPGTVNVTVPAACTYDTVPGPAWLSVTSGGSGAGPGPVTLSFSAAANSTTIARSGTLTIGGTPFTVVQDPTLCSVTMDTSQLGGPFGANGGGGNIAITTNGANCPWTAGSDSTWASVNPTAGSGNGTVHVTVTSNAGSSATRSSNLTIAGQTIAVMQAGTTCMYSLGSSTASVPYGGGTGSVRVSAPGVCGWSSTADPSASWLNITSSGTGGTSDVTFTASPNTSTAPRTGTLTIAGLPYVVTEAAAPCNYSLSQTNIIVSAEGASSSFTFTTLTAGCGAQAQSYSNWLSVRTDTAASGTSGTVNFTAMPNPSGMLRIGTIQLAGQTFTVRQTASACAYSLTSYGAIFGQSGGSGSVIASPTAVGCTPSASVDQPSILTLGALSGPTLNLFMQPYMVSPFNSVVSGTRRATVTLGGQVFTIKQTSW